MTEPVEHLLDPPIPGVIDAFVGRIPGVDVAVDREAALAALAPKHQEMAENLGFSGFCRAEQVHGAGVAVVTAESVGAAPVAGVDGLVTDQADVLLGIYVADCGAVYLVDPKNRAIGLVHSGKKGTEMGIVPEAIALMGRQFGSRPADLRICLGPCIRPPAYEVDFAAAIKLQCEDAGVPPEQFADAGVCTAREVERYYSYRLEKGKTGRMLALLGLES